MSISRLDVESRTLEIFKRLRKNKSYLQLDWSFSQMGADDLDIIDVVLDVEDEFHIVVPDSVAREFSTGRDVVNYVLSCSDAW